MRRDLWFAHCQQLVAQEQLKLETAKAQKEQLRAQLQEVQAALEKEKHLRMNEVPAYFLDFHDFFNFCRRDDQRKFSWETSDIRTTSQ